jgi:putative flippase GtrA
MNELYRKHRDKIAYLIIGGWNTVFGYGTFALLYYFLSDNTHYSIILTLSYIISVTNAYIAYKLIVFKTKGNVIREYFRFYVVYSGAYFVNLLLFPLFINKIGVNPYFAQAVITVFTIMGSYVLHKRFSFKKF